MSEQAAGSAKGYVIAEISVTDAEAYQHYVGPATEAVAASGGRYIVRGGTNVSLEGPPPAGRVVVLEFPTLQAAKDWYYSDAYQAAAALRQAASNGRMFLVEGAPPTT